MLSVKIDRRQQIATFSGDTYPAKESIKSCGVARWDKGEKCWVVSEFVLSNEELLQLLPDVEVEEVATATAASGVKPESGPSVIVDPSLPESFTVTEVVGRAERAILSAFPQAIYIRGVIASMKERPDGTIFLSLTSEEKSDVALQGVVWSANRSQVVTPLEKKGFAFEPNIEVMLGVQVKFRRQRGELSLTVVRIVPEYTVAKLLAQREKTNQRLKSEGIFEKNKSRKLTFLPQRLGIITSSAGTVIHDFRTALDTSRFNFELLWCHASVQGEGAASEVIAALATLVEKEVDAILIFRGGGSASDLAVFNEYELAKAVCLCPIPVFSAIGHQADQSSVQDVSYHTEGVPQGLGRFFAEIVLGYRRDIDRFAKTISQRVQSVNSLWNEKVAIQMRRICSLGQRSVRDSTTSVQRIASSVLRYSRERTASSITESKKLVHMFIVLAKSVMKTQDEQLRRYPQVIQSILRRMLTYRTERLESFGVLIKASSPEVQLKRGFAIVRSEASNEIVTRASMVTTEQVLTLEFVDDSKKVVAK